MNLSSRAVEAAKSMLSGEAGLKVSVEAIQELRGNLEAETRFEVNTDYWHSKVTERVPANRFPKISVSLVKLKRGQQEKLTDSSALATLQIEVINTLERADLLQSQLSDFVDAICDVLNRNSGLWSQGVFYAGGFTVEIQPVSKGGLNYVQNATITFEIHLWQD
ncbi:hypothetical protein [Bryobacter aggregatus]|uniref:hypothetical protein n=1 Tax=Bryobacter aggregatus TaxID=360054 RepID=UPI0004E135A3|nr:hypothetical protein [Bryobacter aggregatus]